MAGSSYSLNISLSIKSLSQLTGELHRWSRLKKVTQSFHVSSSRLVSQLSHHERFNRLTQFHALTFLFGSKNEFTNLHSDDNSSIGFLVKKKRTT